MACLVFISYGFFTWQSNNMGKWSPNHAQRFLSNKYTVFTMGGTVALRSPSQLLFGWRATDLQLPYLISNNQVYGLLKIWTLLNLYLNGLAAFAWHQMKGYMLLYFFVQNNLKYLYHYRVSFRWQTSYSLKGPLREKRERERCILFIFLSLTNFVQ